MSIGWVLKNLIASLLLPPGNALALFLVAWFYRRRKWALGLAATAFLFLLAQSLEPCAQWLIEPLERRAGPVLADVKGASAIVVLGSGLDAAAPEFGTDTVSWRTLVRLRYAAIVARRHSLPVLAAGGMGPGSARSEAEAMAEVMEREFGIPVRWQERTSEDTAENAIHSARILNAAGINRVVLVTHAFHMPRAIRLFERAGLEVVPAPTAFTVRGEDVSHLHRWLPRSSSLHLSNWALHEWIGLGWLEISEYGARLTRTFRDRLT